MYTYCFNIIYTIIIILLYLYKKQLSPKLPNVLEPLYKYRISRFIIVFLLCTVKFKILPHISIMVALLFIII